MFANCSMVHAIHDYRQQQCSVMKRTATLELDRYEPVTIVD